MIKALKNIWGKVFSTPEKNVEITISNWKELAGERKIRTLHKLHLDVIKQYCGAFKFKNDYLYVTNDHTLHLYDRKGECIYRGADKVALASVYLGVVRKLPPITVESHLARWRVDGYEVLMRKQQHITFLKSIAHRRK